MVWFGCNITNNNLSLSLLKLNSFKLNDGPSASSYLNNCIMFNQKLGAKSEGMTTDTKRSTLLDGITDDNYNVVKQQLIGDVTKGFDSCVTRVWQREQELMKHNNTGANSKRKALRTVSKIVNVTSSSSRSRMINIPDFPLSIFKASRKKFHAVLKKDLMNWRKYGI